MGLPPNTQVVRGKVYAKATGRYMGLLSDFVDISTEVADAVAVPSMKTTVEPEPIEEMAAAPTADDMTKAELMEIADQLELVGRSSMTKAELIEALVEVGRVRKGDA